MNNCVNVQLLKNIWNIVKMLWKSLFKYEFYQIPKQRFASLSFLIHQYYIFIKNNPYNNNLEL